MGRRLVGRLWLAVASGRQVPAPKRPDCQAKEANQTGLGASMGMEQDSDLFRMDWGRREEEKKVKSPGRGWGGESRKPSVEGRKM